MNEESDETQAPASGAPKLRAVSAEDLQQILADHQKWLDSSGKEGERANLVRTDLRGRNLAKANLQKAKLDGADLRSACFVKTQLSVATLLGADLRGADLSKARLHGATLEQAQFQGACLIRAELQGKDGVLGANLLGATLQEADLQDADLSDVKGLLASQLASANVSGAKLPPEIQKFEGLAHVEETSKNARKIFLAMLLGCVYSWLTIATTTDARLLTNSASSPLPIIQTEVPIALLAA